MAMKSALGWLHLFILHSARWMRSPPLLSLLSLCTLCHSQSVAGKVLEKTVEEWMRYKDECYQWMTSTPRPLGLHCNRTFDMYACWPDGTPGATTSVSCPYYLPWFQKVKNGLVSRRWGLDGQWEMINGTQAWRNSSQCDDEMEVTRDEVVTRDLLLSFRALYTVGYSVSLLALLSSLLILTMCRKLRCTRNYIHANLFFSFALRGISVIVRDVLQEKRWGMQIIDVSDWEVLISNKAAVGCRTAQVIMQYCILANHYWFVVEAVYLYKVLIGAVFSEKNNYTLYLYLGWGTPVLFVVPWMTLKYLKENKELAKATLTLIPLFGIHEVVFIFATDEQTSGTLRYVKVFFNLFFSSFQGFLVAVLYCFANKEVKYEMQKKWQLWKMNRPALCLR
ncbi:glucagon receptor-like [Pyxicephalus adspersus]|uniref:glucagon receptor-like n=1 Tax=Pyxicephalus adspersus TaxID=30357 RepID=UPI003B5B74C5